MSALLVATFPQGASAGGVSAGSTTCSYRLNSRQICTQSCAQVAGVRTNPSVSFAPAVNYAGQYALGLATGDLRNDGKLDLVLASYGSPSGGGGPGAVQVFLGNGDGTFAAPVTYPTDTGDSCAVVLSDLTGNGILDIVTGNGCYSNTAPHSYSVLLGKGDGTLPQPSTTRSQSAWASLHLSPLGMSMAIGYLISCSRSRVTSKPPASESRSAMGTGRLAQ